METYKVKRLTICFALLFLSSLQPLLFAQDNPTSLSRYSYMEHLFYQGDYYRAITEILRRDFTGMGNPVQERLLLTKAHYFLGDYFLVQEEAKKILAHSFIDERVKKEAGQWLTFSYLMQEKPEVAKISWMKWGPGGGNFPDRESLSGRVNPDHAKLLSSIVPGSGFLLTGSYGKALSSFLINALFIAGVVHYWQEKNYGIAGLLLFFEFGWYFGGRSASEDNAKAYNRALWLKSRDKWIEARVREQSP